MRAKSPIVKSVAIVNSRGSSEADAQMHACQAQRANRSIGFIALLHHHLRYASR
jgi:hypothetical protein